MRYDDPQRPVSDAGAETIPLQVNRSPLPVITLIRPMESEGEEVATCTGERGCLEGFKGQEECEVCHRVRPTILGWLACIHAHHGDTRFGYYTAWIGDIGQFSRDFLADPEGALRRYFRYNGPEERRAIPRSTEEVPDLWEGK